MTKRLEMILDMVPRGLKVADIGCDHGMLCEMLLARGDSAIGIDISESSLRKAAMRLEGRLEVRLGDGFAALAPDEVDCAVIAGIGGEGIARILAEAPYDLGGMLLVLQPSTGVHDLRTYLASGFQVLDERLVFERGRYYFAISARYDGRGREISRRDAEAGALLLKRRERLLEGYLEWRRKVLLKALDGAAGTPARLELKEAADAAEEGLKWLRR